MKIEIKENSILILLVDTSTIFIYTCEKFINTNKIYKLELNLIYKTFIKINFNDANNFVNINENKIFHILISNEENLSRMIQSDDSILNRMALTILLENNKDMIIKYINKLK